MKTNTACLLGTVLCILALAYLFAMAMLHPELGTPGYDMAIKALYFTPALLMIVVAIVLLSMPYKK